MSETPECKYFGTDGVRDVAGRGLLAPAAVDRWGEAIARYIRRAGRSGKIGPLLIGRDTRESGPWISRRIAAVLSAHDLLTLDAGVIPTAAVSFLVRDLGAGLGIVVSASHNPAEYNGLKLIDAGGRKLSPRDERAIEEIWETLPAAPAAACEDSAAAPFSWEERYLSALSRHFKDLSLAGKTVLLDCASGAAHKIAPCVFAHFGARVKTVDPAPDGRNINSGFGALHPEPLLQAHRAERPLVSFAFDGDADRVLLLDAQGTLRDGDDILAFAATARRTLTLEDPLTVVTTVLSNVGLDLFLAPLGVRVLRCDVGDRHVTEAVLRTGALVGGEPSGHVVFPDWGPTGDGIVTALSLLALAQDAKLDFAGALAGFARAPSIARNIKVAQRPPLETLPSVAAALSEGRRDLAEAGRILLRYSGTEPLARVLVEGRDAQRCERIADRIAEAIRQEVGA